MILPFHQFQVFRWNLRRLKVSLRKESNQENHIFYYRLIIQNYYYLMNL